MVPVIETDVYTHSAVVFFCHDGAGKFVINRRSKNCRDEIGKYDCGGGKIESGEGTENALQREVKQEYCADVLSYELLGKRSVRRINNGKIAIWQIYDYKVLVDRNCVKNGEPDKFDCVGFSTLEKIPHPRHSELDGCLKKYWDKLIA